MRRLCATILIISCVGCITSSKEVREVDGNENSVRKEDCSRFEAAIHAYGEIYNPVKIQKMAIKDCGRGDPYACVAVPIAFPFALLVSVVSVPLIPILLMSPDIQNRTCPKSATATTVDELNLNSSRGENKVHDGRNLSDE